MTLVLNTVSDAFKWIRELHSAALARDRRIVELEHQVDTLEHDRVIERRRPPRIPKFPDTLRLYGHKPPQERAG